MDKNVPPYLFENVTYVYCHNVQVKIKTNLKYCVSLHLISFLIIN